MVIGFFTTWEWTWDGLVTYHVGAVFQTWI